VGRSIARAVAVGLLAATGGLGTHGGITEMPAAVTPLQISVTTGVLLYGVLGLVAAYGVIRGRWWSARVIAGWVIAITYVSATAALAYGGRGATVIGAVAAGASAALIGAFVLWAVRVPASRSVPLS
jgi:hypothetical protein